MNNWSNKKSILTVQCLQTAIGEYMNWFFFPSLVMSPVCTTLEQSSSWLDHKFVIWQLTLLQWSVLPDQPPSPSQQFGKNTQELHLRSCSLSFLTNWPARVPLSKEAGHNTLQAHYNKYTSYLFSLSKKKNNFKQIFCWNPIFVCCQIPHWAPPLISNINNHPRFTCLLSFCCYPC